MPFCAVLTEHQLNQTPASTATAVQPKTTVVESVVNNNNNNNTKSLVNSSGAQELRQAANAGNVQVVKELCKKTVPFDADIEGRTALHYASANGHTLVVKELIAAGLPVNAKDALGYTPLLHAATDGHVEVVKLLLKNKAFVDAQDDVHYNSALHEASWKGYSQTIEVLGKNKANPYLKNKQGHSALHLACQQGHNQSCRILLLNGCKPDIKNNFGDSPLHSAARYGHAGVVRILLSAFCNVNEVNKNGDTALHISAAMGRKKLTRILLEAGSNPTIQNKQGETAMSICIRKNYPDVQEIIANPPLLKPPSLPQTKSSEPIKTTAKREKDSSQGSKDSSEKRRQDRFKKTRSGSSRSVHFTTDVQKSKLKNSSKKVLSTSCDWSPYGCHMHPNVNDFPKPKLDSLPDDPLTKGEQYYIDLAGNIRKGPVGFANKCFCRPLIQNVEKRMEKDKQELIEHIDFAHENLTEKICSLEKKTHSHLVSLNEAVSQKLATERLECNERVQRCALKERIEIQRRQRLQIEALKGEVKTWLNSKLDNHRRSCGEQLDQFRDNEFNENQNRNPYPNQIHNNPYYNYHQNYRQSYPLERTTSHVNVPSMVYHSQKQQMSDQQMMSRPKSSDEVLNRCVSNSQQKNHIKPIPRSKSDMFLTESADTGSEDEDDGDEDEEEEEEERNDRTVPTNSNDDLNRKTVPNVETCVENNINAEKRQPVYGLEADNSVEDFQRLGARPKEPLRIRTSNDTINEANVISDQNSGSSLEMSAHHNNNPIINGSNGLKDNRSYTQFRANSESDQISADINLSADLMKTLRCNGSMANGCPPGGDTSADSPFNDSGYRTKFSPSPREVSLLTTTSTNQTTHPNSSHTSNPSKFAQNYHKNIHLNSHHSSYPSQCQTSQNYGVFDPPIGLPTKPQQIRKISFTPNHPNRTYNGPNSSLV